MKYVLLAYAEPAAWDEMTDEERTAWVADDAAFNAHLADLRCVVHGEGLADGWTATTVRVKGGEVVVTDGPAADGTEVLGGYLAIDVDDLDAALAIARRSPAARTGPLEIRPIRVSG